MPPINDNFDDAIVISGSAGSVTGTNVGATWEVGEPVQYAGDGTNTVWWRWVPPSTDTYQIKTAGSDFDTVLQVYTGSSLGSLSRIAGNDDSGGTVQSTVTVTLTGGVTYQIRVQGFDNDSEGTIHLAWKILVPMPNPFQAFNFTRGVRDVTGSLIDSVGWNGIKAVNGHSAWGANQVKQCFPGDVVIISGTFLSFTTTLKLVPLTIDNVFLVSQAQTLTSWTISGSNILLTVPPDAVYGVITAYNSVGDGGLGQNTSPPFLYVMDPNNPGPYKNGIDNGLVQMRNGLVFNTAAWRIQRWVDFGAGPSTWGGPIVPPTSLDPFFDTFSGGGSSQSVEETQTVVLFDTSIFDDLRPHIGSLTGQTAPDSNALIEDTIYTTISTAPNDPEMDFSGTPGPRGDPYAFEYDPTSLPVPKNGPYKLWVDGNPMFSAAVQQMEGGGPDVPRDPDPSGIARAAIANTTLQYTRITTSTADFSNHLLNNAYLPSSSVNPDFEVTGYLFSQTLTAPSPGFNPIESWQVITAVHTHQVKQNSVHLPQPDGEGSGDGVKSIRLSDFDANGLMAWVVTTSRFGNPLYGSNGIDQIRIFLNTGGGSLTFDVRFIGPRFRYYYLKYATAITVIPPLRLSNRDDQYSRRGSAPRIADKNHSTSAQVNPAGRIPQKNVYY